MLERVFKLKENNTRVKTEIIAGLTTFMTMAYIIALNPNLLTNFDSGSPLWNGVFLATCIASAIGMFGTEQFFCRGRCQYCKYYGNDLSGFLSGRVMRHIN